MPSLPDANVNLKNVKGVQFSIVSPEEWVSLLKHIFLTVFKQFNLKTFFFN